MKSRPALLAGLLLLLLPGPSPGQSRTWELGLAGGLVYNVPTALHLVQDHHPPLHLRAIYRTEPFRLPVYYDLRLGTRRQGRGWDLKFTHHKLILDNLPPEVQRFSITNGFNLLTWNRAWPVRGFQLSAGLGTVITHPESTVRQRAYPENKGLFNRGYYLSGPVVELAIARRQEVARRWFLFGEGRATAAYVEVPIAGGHARVSNVAGHLLGGVGFRLLAPENTRGTR